MARRIVVYEDDKKVYEGPENRHSQNVALVQPSKFGLPLETWIKIGGFIIAGVIFYVRTDEFMKSQGQINDYIMTFARNSDNYHSATTGRQFEQGKPTGFVKRAYAADENRGVVSGSQREEQHE